MRTLLRCGLVLGCLATFVAQSADAWAIPITVGPGTAPSGGIDGGTPTNLDRNVTAPLTPADNYMVTKFDVRVSNSGGGRAVVPFLAVGSPSTYTVLWVGPAFVPGSDGVHNLTYSPLTEQFTLVSTGTIFGGVNSVGGPLLEFAGGGTTDHQTNPGFGTIVVGQTLTAFSNAGLGRTYSFDIVFDQLPPVPEPSTFALLSVGVIGLMLRTRRSRRML